MVTTNNIIMNGVSCRGWAKAFEASSKLLSQHKHPRQPSWVAKPHTTISTPSSIHDQELPKVHLLLEFFSSYMYVCQSVCLSHNNNIMLFFFDVSSIKRRFHLQARLYNNILCTYVRSQLHRNVYKNHPKNTKVSEGNS